MLKLFQSTAFRTSAVAVLSLIVGATVKGVVEETVREWWHRHQAPLPIDALAGRWSCIWTVESPPGWKHPQIVDQVELKTNRDGTVMGEGANEYYGRYVLAGQNGPEVVVLNYRELKEPHRSLGVAVLKKLTDRGDVVELSGKWAQLDPPDTWLLGSAACRHIPQ